MKYYDCLNLVRIIFLNLFFFNSQDISVSIQSITSCMNRAISKFQRIFHRFEIANSFRSGNVRLLDTTANANECRTYSPGCPFFFRWLTYQSVAKHTTPDRTGPVCNYSSTRLADRTVLHIVHGFTNRRSVVSMNRTKLTQLNENQFGKKHDRIQ